MRSLYFILKPPRFSRRKFLYSPCMCNNVQEKGMNGIKTYNLIRTESKINCFKFVMGSTFVSFLYCKLYTYIRRIKELSEGWLRNTIKGNCFEFVNVLGINIILNLCSLAFSDHNILAWTQHEPNKKLYHI